MPVVEFEQRGHVAWVTINRPERANTLVVESFRLLTQAWAEVRENPDIRVAVLTGAGTKDFCCGGDLVEYIPNGSKQADAQHEAASYDGASPADALLINEPLYKPIVAAVNGRAYGGGVEILQATDVRIASEDAVFALSEPRWGIIPGAGSMVRLSRQIPWAHAMYTLLTAQAVDAEMALRFGLISEIVPASDVITRAEELAETIARNAPLSMQAIKRVAYETHTLPWDAAHAFEADNSRQVMESADAKEGPAAFAARRPAAFTGR